MRFQRYYNTGPGTIEWAVLVSDDGKRVEIEADLLPGASPDDAVTGDALTAAQDAYDELYTVPPTEAIRQLRRASRRATNNADAIALVMAAIVDADLTQAGTASRTSGIVAALNDPTVSNGFRTVVIAAFNSEDGRTIDLTDTSGLSAADARAFCRFIRRFINTYALLLAQ
jgi:hypothetical protein